MFFIDIVDNSPTFLLHVTFILHACGELFIMCLCFSMTECTAFFFFSQKRVPNYPTMFSVLPHHPRFQMKLESTDPVPKFVSRQWRGYAEQEREAMVRYKTYVLS